MTLDSFRASPQQNWRCVVWVGCSSPPFGDGTGPSGGMGESSGSTPKVTGPDISGVDDTGDDGRRWACGGA